MTCVDSTVIFAYSIMSVLAINDMFLQFSDLCQLDYIFICFSNVCLYCSGIC